MTVARVQDATAGANAASATVTLGASPTSGNLLVAWANSDATVTIGGSGWTAGPSVIDGNGCYLWWKTAGSGEPSTITFTPSVADYICAGVAEYSGLTGSPLDVSGSSTHSGAAVSATTAVSVTTTADHDLGFAVACLHSGPQSAPGTASWTNSWSGLHSAGAVSGSNVVVYSFAADNTDLGTAGSVSTGASWTGTTWPDAQELLITFKAATNSSIPLDAALTQAAAASSAIGRSVSLDAGLGETDAAAAALGRSAPVDAALAQPAAAAVAASRSVPLSTMLPQASGIAASVVDRITHRPNLGITPRPYTGTTTRP